MDNPLKNIQLKNWPDYWLAITGISFALVLGGLISGQHLPGMTVYWVMLLAG
jgi:hypothetical protein